MKNQHKLLVLFCIIIFLSLFLLFYKLDITILSYALPKRIMKIVTIFLSATLIGVSTLIFQTITHNNILSPNILGIDYIYIFVQTIFIFLFSSTHIINQSKPLNMILSLICMTTLSFFIFGKLLIKKKSNTIFLLLIGIVAGTFFSSISTFLQVMIDPADFLLIQDKMFVQFSLVHPDLLFFALIFMIILVYIIWNDLDLLDILILGREEAINLGIHYDKKIKKLFILLLFTTAITTALVGPILFLGILATNLARIFSNTFKHKYLILYTSCISIILVLIAQIIVEHIFHFGFPIIIFINFIGGIYFIFLLFKESKL